jgi:hypothetical protein
MLFTENAANSSLHASRIAEAGQRTDTEPAENQQNVQSSGVAVQSQSPPKARYRGINHAFG